MAENLILKKESSESEIKSYFNSVLKLSKSDNQFPINLDEVWMLVYSKRDKAVRALKENFIENVDYILLPQNGEQVESTKWGGSNKVDYLSLLEQGVNQINFESVNYTDKKGETSSMYNLTKKGCLILASENYEASWSGKFRQKVKQFHRFISKSKKYVYICSATSFIVLGFIMPFRKHCVQNISRVFSVHICPKTNMRCRNLEKCSAFSFLQIFFI